MALHQIILRSTLLLALGAADPASAQDRPPNDRPDRSERPQERPERKEEPKDRPSRDPRRTEPPLPREQQRPQPDNRPREQRSQPPWQDREHREGREERREQYPHPNRDDPGGTRLRSEGPPQRSREQARGWEQQKGWRSQGAWEEHHSWREHRAHQWQDEHRTWVERGGYGGYYIPQDQFRLRFGNQHWFRIHTRPSIYGGYPRFQYGGFWFTLVDPWPEFWSETWYSNDDVYLDYNDGYYLYNRRHPGFGIAVTVSF